MITSPHFCRSSRQAGGRGGTFVGKSCAIPVARIYLLSKGKSHSRLLTNWAKINKHWNIVGTSELTLEATFFSRLLQETGFACIAYGIFAVPRQGRSVRRNLHLGMRSQRTRDWRLAIKSQFSPTLNHHSHSISHGGFMFSVMLVWRSWLQCCEPSDSMSLF